MSFLKAHAYDPYEHWEDFIAQISTPSSEPIKVHLEGKALSVCFSLMFMTEIDDQELQKFPLSVAEFTTLKEKNAGRYVCLLGLLH